MSHESQFFSGNFFKHITIRTDNIKPSIVKRSEIINEFQLTAKRSTIHIECRSKNVNIIVSVELSIHENVLIFFRSNSSNTTCVILSAHKGQLVGRTTELFSRILHVGSIEANGVHFTMRNSLDNEVLEKQIFVVLVSDINRVNDLCNQILNTTDTGERHTEVFLLNGNRVLNSPVHGMECRPNIGESTLELAGFSFLRRELTCFCNIDENFFNSFTELKITFLEVFVHVVEVSRFDLYKGNSVHQCCDKLVCESRISIKDFTDFRDFMFRRNSRNKRLIFIRRIRTNGIQNIERTSIKSTNSNFPRHRLNPP